MIKPLSLLERSLGSTIGCRGEQDHEVLFRWSSSIWVVHTHCLLTSYFGPEDV